jgi:hypothetical protein
MSSPASNVSSSGAIEDFQYLGFTQVDSVSELIDNSLDAGANEIRVRIDTKTNTLFVDDDAVGMDKAKMRSALRLYETKKASDSIGLRGVGMKASMVVLSCKLKPTYIFSKPIDGDAVEACADWPTAIAEDRWNPTPADLSAKRTPIWESGALNLEHGTTIMIPMPPDRIATLIKSLDDLLSELGRRFDVYTRKGKTITIVIDNEPPIALSNSSADEAVDKQTLPIEILRNQDGEERLYYGDPELSGNFLRQGTKKPLRDYTESRAAGFTVIARFTLRSTYSPLWKGLPGYLTPRRGDRYLARIHTPRPGSGDYNQRDVIMSARHELHFTYEEDTFIGVQVNKSDVTPENIHHALLGLVNYLTLLWSKKIYKDVYKVKPPSPENGEFEKALKAAVRDFKKHAKANGIDWLKKWPDKRNTWNADSE